jgi:serine/threonine protein kinase
MNLLSNDALDVERWRRIESVLDVALELPPHEVAAYLDRACAGHPALRAEIEALLEAERRSQGFLSVPAILRTHPFGDVDDTPLEAPLERIGAYRLVGELGRGGMGIVHLGRDDALGREVAIKALPGAVADDPERLARFLHEARLLGMLHDPRIAQIFGLETAGGRRYLILERVAGTTLSERLRAGALPLREAIDTCAQVAAALATAHAYGVVHRDLKPGNIMSTPEGLVKVLDFGLAIHVPDGEPGDANMAEPRAGTPGFMSPEQILGQPQDVRSDLFALGAVLYQCLTGARAFAGGTPYTVIDATLHAPPDFARLPAATPEAVRSLIAALLEKEAAARPRDAAEVAAVLDAAVARPVVPRSRARDALVRGLPRAATPLVGRRRELADIRGLLERAPLVTLVGAGGCGKTRLAIEAAREAELEPVGFADLAAVADAHAVATAIAAALDARDPSEASIIAALGATLGDRPGLLVVDNCDRVVQPVAALASRLIARVRGLRILATSNERLGVAGEQVLRVTPLPLPAADTRLTRDAASAADAVRMFVACASAMNPGFTLTDGNAGVVAGSAAISTACRSRSS